jgi:hypothetical protein
MTIKLYAHPQCFPCKDVKKRLAENGGKIDGEDVAIVDISTDEGFEDFSREVLSKGDGAVPSAYRDGQRCKILHDHNRLKLDCPKEKSAETK